MGKKFIPTVFVMAFIGMFIMPPDLLALDETSSLDCSGGTVLTGDSKDSVREKCGDPQKVAPREGKWSPDIWIYNFGPSEFLYYVTFTNDRVERIQTGDYGN